MPPSRELPLPISRRTLLRRSGMGLGALGLGTIPSSVYRGMVILA